MIFDMLKDRYLRKKQTIKYWKKRGLVIGDDCSINPKAELGSEPYLIRIGNHVRINSGVHLLTHDGGCWVLRSDKGIPNSENIDRFGRISIGNNVHIGTNAFIMPGVKIGNNVIIGCCAVVTKSVPDNTIVAGCPARVIESIDDYFNKHKNEFDLTYHMNAKEKKQYLINKYKG